MSSHYGLCIEYCLKVDKRKTSDKRYILVRNNRWSLHSELCQPFSAAVLDAITVD